MKSLLKTWLLTLLCAPTCLCQPAATLETTMGTTGGRIGVPYDWSHRFQVFSRTDSSDRLTQIQQEPRYWQQLHRKLFERVIPISDPSPGQTARGRAPASRVDWSESLETSALNFNGLASYPAKYSFNLLNPAPDCVNDYIAYTLPVPAANKINLIGFNHLYADSSAVVTNGGFCGGLTLPTPLFVYNASQNNGPLNSSPALSLDGKQIAMVENSNKATFSVLKWHAGDVPSTFGIPFNSTRLTDCAVSNVAPCEYSIQYSTTTAKLSAPYIDYLTDTAYVTDDSGKLYSISPVFNGGQPVVRYSIASGGSMMTPPTYDSVSKNVFAADDKGKLFYFRTVAGSSGTCSSGTPPCLGGTTVTASNNQIFEAPVVDSSSGTVFVFSGGSPDGKNSSVVQATTTLTNAVIATVGTKTGMNTHAGTFDNNYLNNPSTGLLYACGDQGGKPQLYGIAFSGVTMMSGAATHGPLAVTTGNATCSPLTEVYNQTLNRDELYFSVTATCISAVTGACMEAYNVTSGFPTAVSTPPVAEAGGTSGIVIDNVSNPANGTNATNIYFVTLGTQTCNLFTSTTLTGNNGNCAVKLTQSGLK